MICCGNPKKEQLEEEDDDEESTAFRIHVSELHSSLRNKTCDQIKKKSLQEISVQKKYKSGKNEFITQKKCVCHFLALFNMQTFCSGGSVSCSCSLCSHLFSHMHCSPQQDH